MPSKGSVWMYLKAALNASDDARLPQGRETLQRVAVALRGGEYGARAELPYA